MTINPDRAYVAFRELATQALCLVAIWRIIYRIGIFVVDFGFGSLLEKFQDYYGVRATKYLVGLIGATATLVCVNMIWSITSPVVGWGAETVSNTNIYWLVAKFAGFASSLLVLIAGGASFMSLYDSRRLLREVEEMYSDTAAILDEAALTAEEAVDIMTKVKGILMKVDPEWNEEVSMIDESINTTKTNSAKMRYITDKIRSSISKESTSE